ncbi:hypothetical protein [Xenorhabdus bovienii]|nr:hypothetical protein [Xenorhabdus bovienii]
MLKGRFLPYSDSSFLPTVPQSPASLSGSRSGRYIINVASEQLGGGGS